MRTCIQSANLPLSVYCLLARLFSRKYVVPSNPRRANISSSVVSLAKLPIYKSSITGLFMFFLLLLTVRVHSESFVWIDFWWSVRGQSAHDLLCFFSSFSDICSSFDELALFFLLFISSVFLLGWSTALALSKLAGILINDYYKYIQLATSEVLKKFTVQARSRDLSLSGRKVEVLHLSRSATHEAILVCAVQDISLHYACGKSNLEIYQCFMVVFNAWLEKLSKNAPKNWGFLRCLLWKLSWK